MKRYRIEYTQGQCLTDLDEAEGIARHKLAKNPQIVTATISEVDTEHPNAAPIIQRKIFRVGLEQFTEVWRE
jgi:hypothetical protein